MSDASGLVWVNLQHGYQNGVFPLLMGWCTKMEFAAWKPSVYSSQSGGVVSWGSFSSGRIGYGVASNKSIHHPSVFSP